MSWFCRRVILFCVRLSTDRFTHLQLLGKDGCKHTILPRYASLSEGDEQNWRRVAVNWRYELVESSLGRAEGNVFPFTTTPKTTLWSLVPAWNECPNDSYQNFLENSRFFDAGETHVEALEGDAETLVVNAQQVQHRGVQVADVDDIFDRVVA